MYPRSDIDRARERGETRAVDTPGITLDVTHTCRYRSTRSWGIETNGPEPSPPAGESRAITGDTALRLGHFFGTSPKIWLNLQCLYDLRLAEAPHTAARV